MLRGPDRARHGAMFVLRNVETGEERTVVRPGLLEFAPRPDKRGSYERVVVGLMDIMREMADELDRGGGREKIRLISTPASILNDLRNAGQHRSRSMSSRESVGKYIGQQSYEEMLLSKIGRLDLLLARPAWRSYGVTHEA